MQMVANKGGGVKNREILNGWSIGSRASRASLFQPRRRHSQFANHARTHTQQSSAYKFVKCLRSPSRISRDFIWKLSLAAFILPERFRNPPASRLPAFAAWPGRRHSQFANHARTHSLLPPDINSLNIWDRHDRAWFHEYFIRNFEKFNNIHTTTSTFISFKYR